MKGGTPSEHIPAAVRPMHRPLCSDLCARQHQPPPQSVPQEQPPRKALSLAEVMTEQSDTDSRPQSGGGGNAGDWARRASIGAAAVGRFDKPPPLASVASAAPARLAGDGVEQYRLGHGQARAAGPAPTQALNQGYAGVVKPGYDRWNRYKDAPHTKTKAASSWRVQAKEEDPEFQGDSRWNTTGPRKTNQW